MAAIPDDVFAFRPCLPPAFAQVLCGQVDPSFDPVDPQWTDGSRSDLRGDLDPRGLRPVGWDRDGGQPADPEAAWSGCEPAEARPRDRFLESLQYRHTVVRALIRRRRRVRMYVGPTGRRSRRGPEQDRRRGVGRHRAFAARFLRQADSPTGGYRSSPRRSPSR